MAGLNSIGMIMF